MAWVAQGYIQSMKYPKKDKERAKSSSILLQKRNSKKERQRPPSPHPILDLSISQHETYRFRPFFFFPITASPQQSKTRKSSFSKKTNKNNLFSIPSLGGPNLQQTLETPTNLPCFLGSTFLPSHPSPPTSSDLDQLTEFSLKLSTSKFRQPLWTRRLQLRLEPKNPKPQPGTADVMRAASQAAFGPALAFLTENVCLS